MKHNAISLRPFIGAKNFNLSRQFYTDLGYEEHIISPDMSYFKTHDTVEMGFYLQDYYAKDWINNTMLFLEIDDVEAFWNELVALELDKKYKGVKLTPIKYLDWGCECFLHDPSGILWHFGKFNK
jgi:tRNA A37 threonylcarbamoyladenosine biosynthesis protein TsaE